MHPRLSSVLADGSFVQDSDWGMDDCAKHGLAGLYCHAHFDGLRLGIEEEPCSA